MNFAPETRMAGACDVGHSTSRGEATTYPVTDRLRIPRTSRFVYAVAGEREGSLMMATARLV